LKRKFFFWIFYSGLLLGITLFLFEVVIRLATPFLPEPARSFFDEASRLALSNARVYYGVTIQLPPDPKAEILTVGDSYTFGSLVGEKDTVAAYLEQMTGMNTVNLGIGAQEVPAYILMMEVGMRYHLGHSECELESVWFAAAKRIIADWSLCFCRICSFSIY